MDPIELHVSRLVCQKWRKFLKPQFCCKGWRNIIKSSSFSGYHSILLWIKYIFLRYISHYYSQNFPKAFAKHNSVVMDGAASCGRVDILKWGFEVGCETSSSACRFAADAGHLEALIWLHEHQFPCILDVCIAAIENEHLHVLQWLLENMKIRNHSKYRLVDLTARTGNLEMLKYLIETKKFPISEDVFTNAVSGGNVEMLKWLEKNDCFWTDEAMGIAIRGRYLEVIKWLHENGCPWSDYHGLQAVDTKSVEIVTYMYNRGCKFDSKASAAAAFPVFKALRECGLEWSENTLEDSIDIKYKEHILWDVACLLYTISEPTRRS